MGHDLQNGATRSCGCIKTSWGEENIAVLLEANNLSFEREKQFDSCILPSGRKAKFDFYVNYSYLIEFDGRQHFEEGAGWDEPLEDI